MVVQHNIAALNAYRQFNANTNSVSKNLEKLSSGYKINRAGDDASGLAISEKMRAQISGLQVAQDNAQDGISLVQTAEGALTEVHSMLNRMSELAEKSSNGTIQDDVDRDAIQKETNDLISEIDRISQSTNFNGITLLDGTLGGYHGASVAAAGSVYNVDPITVSNGKLEATDAFTLTAATTTGVVTLTALTVNGHAYTEGQFSAAGIVVNGDANNPAGAGNFKFTITMQAGTATQEDYEALNGLQISMTTIGGDSSKHDATFTVTPDANGHVGGGLTLQIGDSNDSYQKVTVSVDDLSSKGLGLQGLDVSNQTTAGNAIKTIKDAINKVSTNRGNLGGLQNRLEYTINNLSVTEENMTAAESNIRDTDMAEEMMAYTKNNVLTQAAQAMLAQANTQPQSVLQLLK